MDLSGEALFQKILTTNRWRSPESVSGPGAEMRQTEDIRAGLAALLASPSFAIRSMLDIPCGDFNWMQHVAGIEALDYYIGADVVRELVEQTSRRYGGCVRRRFLHLDITRDPLPRADLVFVRDLMVHLTLDECLDALANIRSSGGGYLMATSYPAVLANTDTSNGNWRPINLRLAPFELPEPLLHIEADFTDGGKHYPGNGMSVWRIADL